MKTIKEITIALKQATQLEPWMDAIQRDERAGVQRAWASFEKRLAKEQAVLEAHKQKLQFDASYLPHADAYLAGVDEAGRGPLAGPVVTAAVVLPNYCQELVGINDSKQLTKEMRENYAARIKEHAISYFVHFQPAEVIDSVNIYEATRQSMLASVEGLAVQPDIVIADAMTLPVAMPQHAIIKGDAQSLSIAAASILAKTARDEYMEQLDKEFPQYGFAQHAGYGTKQHLEALEEFGPTEHHRKSFEPIKSMMKR